MTQLEQLGRDLAQLDTQLASCMRCGLCQGACPVYGLTAAEPHVARGKLALLHGLASRLLDDPGTVRDRLEVCVLCGSCAAACPSGVRTQEILLAARAILAEYEGLSLPEKLVFRQIAPRPRLFNALISVGGPLLRLVSRPAHRLTGTARSSLLSPLLGDRHFPLLATTPFRSGQPAAAHARPRAAGERVALFYGCLVDRVFPRVGDAFLRLADRHGLNAFVPHGLACCGIPALASGDPLGARRAIDANLQALAQDEPDVIVTPCATCTWTLRKLWPALAAEAGEPLASRAAAVAARTLDVHEYLVARLGPDGLAAAPAAAGPAPGEPRTVTYHDPCHLAKSLGVRSQPRVLLRAAPGWRFVDMAEPDSCCGSGGSFSLKHYDLAAGIAERKRDRILASGATTVATGCPACMLHLLDVLSRHHDPITVCHSLEVFAGPPA